MEVLLLESDEDLAGLSPVDLAAESDLESSEEEESEELEEDEVSLEPFLFSAGFLGRP